MGDLRAVGPDRLAVLHEASSPQSEIIATAAPRAARELPLPIHNPETYCPNAHSQTTYVTHRPHVQQSARPEVPEAALSHRSKPPVDTSLEIPEGYGKNRFSLPAYRQTALSKRRLPVFWAIRRWAGCRREVLYRCLGGLAHVRRHWGRTAAVGETLLFENRLAYLIGKVLVL